MYQFFLLKFNCLFSIENYSFTKYSFVCVRDCIAICKQTGACNSFTVGKCLINKSVKTYIYLYFYVYHSFLPIAH